MDLYRERLWATPWLFVSTILVVPAVMLVFAPINFAVGVVLAIVFYAAIVIALLASAPVIRVTAAELIAGNAKIPLEFIGSRGPSPARRRRWSAASGWTHAPGC